MNGMKRYGIVAIGYNRIDSLERLLNALNKAVYKDYKPLLIISLDHAGMPEIIELAEQFPWEHGVKVVRAYTERQGLRRHILNCGNYMEEYDLDAVAVFEDDVYPSPAYFNYMTQAVDYYGEDERIAGISLYTHLWNNHGGNSFSPLFDEKDTFFIQCAQSWGQIWLRKQWNDFITWYEKNKENFRTAAGVPRAVSEWKDSSWLKYHIRYCADTEKYFVYPYEALSTNYTDVGTHNDVSTTLFQVPMQMSPEKVYRFSDLETTKAVYDVYFENQRLAQSLDLSPEELCVDLYGSKESVDGKRYWLTMKQADYHVVQSFGLRLKPHEANVMLHIKGDDIKLYDLSRSQKNTLREVSSHLRMDYYYRTARCRGKSLLQEVLYRVWNRVLSKVLKRK